jgi:hypothetical protein
MPAKSAASAAATVPPLAVTKAGLYVDARVVSKSLSYVPLMTPIGNRGNEGVVVATPAFPGGATQQWMCAIVVAPTRSLKLTTTWRVCVTISKSTKAVPVPGDGAGGFSLGPSRNVVNGMA